MRVSVFKQSFHSPCGRASHFLLLVQEKVTKEKHALGIALFGLLPEKCASACLCSAAGIAAAAAAMQKGTQEQRAPARKNNSASNDVRRYENTRCNASTLSNPLLRGA